MKSKGASEMPIFKGAKRKRKAHPDLVRLADDARDSLRWSEAAVNYKAHLEIFPEDAAIWVQLGNVLKENGQFSDSEHAYSQAITLAPKSSDTHLQLGHLYKITARKNEALLSYEIAYVLDYSCSAAKIEILALRNELIQQSSGHGVVDKNADFHKLDERINSLALQLERILGHFAATRALGFEVARLSRRVDKLEIKDIPND